MKKRRTKQQKRAALKKMISSIQVPSTIAPTQLVEANINSYSNRPVTKKVFSSINTQFIKKDLLKSLSITIIILILLFGIKLFLG